jgi:hypothetical protein
MFPLYCGSTDFSIHVFPANVTDKSDLSQATGTHNVGIRENVEQQPLT